MRYPSPSQWIASTLGLQQTWQSSTYNCLLPPDSSTTVSFHSPQPAHWYPASKGMVASVESQAALSLTEGTRVRFPIASIAYHLPPPHPCAAPCIKNENRSGGSAFAPKARFAGRVVPLDVWFR